MVEYFDERCTECVKDNKGEPDIGMNCSFLKYVQAYYTNWNKLKDVRLSEIYYALGMPFPDNYLIDYKLKKDEPAFEFCFDAESAKIKIAINVPDQPVLRDTGDTLEYTFTFKKED